jgi:hypothetical protein
MDMLAKISFEIKMVYLIISFNVVLSNAFASLALHEFQTE